MFDGFFGFPKYQKQHRMGSQNIMNKGKMQIFTLIMYIFPILGQSNYVISTQQVHNLD